MMSGKSGSSNGTDGGDEIDTALLEKRLEGLRDTQESVQGLSLWCQANKRHTQIIVDTWLRILRKSPIEKRLTMFYLANDVIQHAKRKSDQTVVNQWAFAIQKATPHVRSPSSVSNAIARIFKIWEERGVYSKDAIADLLSLLNNVSSKEKVVEKKPETYTANAEKVAAFQPSQLISKIKLAYRLKSHLGTTFRTKSYCQMEMSTLKTSIKDRQHGQDVIQEMGTLVEQLRTSEMKLQTEVEERRKIVEIGEIALVFYENVRSESKIVNAAYKNFTNRVMKAHDSVDSKLKTFEEMEKEPSPCPSPPAMAPSPTDDDDLETSLHLHSRGSSSIEVVNPLEISTSVPFSASSLSGGGMNSSTESRIMSNIPTAMSYSAQMTSTGYETRADSQQRQQFSSWNDGSEHFPSSQEAQQFTPLHMQGQSYGFHNKFDLPDLSSIPLPPTNPPPPSLQNPPLPQDVVVVPQYQPPLPPPVVTDHLGSYQPENPSLSLNDRSVFGGPDVRENFLHHPPPPPLSGKYAPLDSMYPPAPANRMPEKEYFTPAMQIPSDGGMYIPQQAPPPVPADQMYPQMPLPSSSELPNFPVGPPQHPPPEMLGQDFQNPMLSPRMHPSDGLGPNSTGPGVVQDEFYEDYNNDSESHHQFGSQGNNNYHPYNPSQRNRRPGRPQQPPSRNLQPLLAAPNSRFGNPALSPGQSNRFPDQNPGLNKIPSLLETPVSPTSPQGGGFRPSHQNFDSYSTFEGCNSGPSGANTGGNDGGGGYHFDGFQSQQQPNPFSNNNNNFGQNHMSSPPPRRGGGGGPVRGFRGGGGFRGSPRIRGGPGGPRRGRF